jgi:hypothetical protein
MSLSMAKKAIKSHPHTKSSSRIEIKIRAVPMLAP